MNRIFRMLLLMPLCLYALVPLSDASAQEASVNTTRTDLETPIRLSITLTEGDGAVDTSAIEDFKVLSQSSSSSVQIINGKMNSQRTKTYTLLPLREGRLTIPALKVTIDGKTRYTEPISVQVEKGQTATDAASESVQVYGTVTDASPYLGQQIVYTFRLMYAVQLANTDYEPPSFEGFSATQIGEQETGQRVVGGQRFQEVAISYLLVPMKTGAITIDPARLQCDVTSSQRSNRSQFDSFFNDPFFGSSRLETKVFRTDPVTVDVLPLPAWSGGDPFSGLVGQFDMRTEMETDTATVGQSVTLSVTLEGRGNLQDAEAPALQVPDAFKQYADQPETDVQLKSDGYAGSRVFRTALVPVTPGTYTLSAAPLVYFDPAQKAYRRLTTAPLTLTVAASQTPAETPTVFSALDDDTRLTDPQKKKVGFTGRDILSIKTDLDAIRDQEAMATAWFVGLLLAPGLVLLALVGIQRAVRKDRRPAAEMTRKSRMALKEASATGTDDASLLSNLYRALLYAVFARAGISGESLTAGEVSSLLERGRVDGQTAAAAMALFNRLESARFGKASLSPQEQTSLISETRKLVNGLIR